MFARHGVPETVRSDNGPQFASMEFTQFAREYGFRHVTSSPRYPQSNGQVERTVQSIKRMIKKSEDPHIAVLSYRATPFPWCGLSPAELCMGRRIRTTVPQTKASLVPQWPILTEFRRLNDEVKAKQKRQFDRRHRVSERDDISDGTDVWITSESQPIRGTVTSSGNSPRSYVVETPSGEVRRNRAHLRVVPERGRNGAEEPPSAVSTTPIPPTPKVIMTRSRTGTTIEKGDVV